MSASAPLLRGADPERCLTFSMSNPDQDPSGVVGGTPDGSFQNDVDTGGSTTLDTVMDHRKQVIRRVQALERLEQEKASQKKDPGSRTP